MAPNQPTLMPRAGTDDLWAAMEGLVQAYCDDYAAGKNHTSQLPTASELEDYRTAWQIDRRGAGKYMKLLHTGRVFCFVVATSFLGRQASFRRGDILRPRNQKQPDLSSARGNVLVGGFPVYATRLAALDELRPTKRRRLDRPPPVAIGCGLDPTITEGHVSISPDHEAMGALFSDGAAVPILHALCDRLPVYALKAHLATWTRRHHAEFVQPLLRIPAVDPDLRDSDHGTQSMQYTNDGRTVTLEFGDRAVLEFASGQAQRSDRLMQATVNLSVLVCSLAANPTTRGILLPRLSVAHDGCECDYRMDAPRLPFRRDIDEDDLPTGGDRAMCMGPYHRASLMRLVLPTVLRSLTGLRVLGPVTYHKAGVLRRKLVFVDTLSEGARLG